jgi:cell division septum initiation protein DivIVA
MVLMPPDNARLTPERVHAMTFRLSRRGRRGLDEDDVHGFCDRVERELRRLLEERSALYAEVSRLRRRLRRPPPGAAGAGGAGAHAGMPLGAPVGGTPDLGPLPGGPTVQATRILLKAQQTADRYVADAQAYSREIAEDAHRRREQILAEAKARASILIEEAHYAAARSVSARPRAETRFPF